MFVQILPALRYTAETATVLPFNNYPPVQLASIAAAARLQIPLLSPLTLPLK